MPQEINTRAGCIRWFIVVCSFEAKPRRLAANRVRLQVGVCRPGEFRAPSAMALSSSMPRGKCKKSSDTLRRVGNSCNAQDPEAQEAAAAEPLATELAMAMETSGGGGEGRH